MRRVIAMARISLIMAPVLLMSILAPRIVRQGLQKPGCKVSVAPHHAGKLTCFTFCAPQPKFSQVIGRSTPEWAVRIRDTESSVEARE
jgi:hypothetical protein